MTWWQILLIVFVGGLILEDIVSMICKMIILSKCNEKGENQNGKENL